MIYQVIKYKNKKLRKKSKEIEIKSKINNVIKNMFETMKDKNGIGLAAPQIGKNIRLFIIKIRNKKKTFKKVFINPKIVNEFGKFCKYEEGCLSIPKIKIKIFRKENVTIEYFDQLWNKKENVFTGIIARIIQHEYDHLEGILHVDHIEKSYNKLK